MAEGTRLTMLDRDIAAFLDSLGDSRLPSEIGVAASRAAMSRRIASLQTRFGVTAVRRTSELTVRGKGRELPARMYTPLAPQGRTLMLFFHSGGHVIGDLDTGDPVARSLCAGVGCDVLSVAYSLAPERPFPSDVLDAAEVVMGADRLFVAGGRYDGLVVAGDSAGATVAAVAANETISSISRPLAAQVLLYGAFDSRIRTLSESQARSDPFLDVEQLRWFQEQYCDPGSGRNDPRISPAAFSELAMAPPTVLATADLDPLRDQGRRYADLLRAAGVRVQEFNFVALPHGFMEFQEASPGAAAAIALICGAVAACVDDANRTAHVPAGSG